jgi:osmotically inducible protein OsmC
MRTSRASAAWEGTLREGKGTFTAGSGAFKGPYSFATRFGDAAGTNPEELIAAAHAACFSMALAAGLGDGGKPPTRIETQAACTMEVINGAGTVTRIELKVRGKVPGLDQAGFAQAAETAKQNCPVSRALNPSVQVSVQAVLE